MLGIQRRFITTPSKEGKSPITILSSRSPYTPTHISTENIEGEEDLICDENMESLPADSSLLEISSSKMFFTPSSINTASIDTNSNSEKNFNPVKRSLRCSPQESASESMSSNDFEHIMKEGGGLSMMSQMNKWMTDSNSLAPKSDMKMESKLISDELLSKSRNNSSVMLEKLPNLSMETGISTFSILNDSKDIPKIGTKGKSEMAGSSKCNPIPRKSLIQAVLGVDKEKAKTKKSLNHTLSSMEFDDKKDMEAPLGEMSSLSFSRFDSVTKDALQIEGTATQMIDREASIGGLSDFGITNFQVSDRSMQVLEGNKAESRLVNCMYLNTHKN